MNARQKKKQEKIAKDRALKAAQDAQKIQDAATKEEERKAAILALQAEQERISRETIEQMANTAAVIATPRDLDETILAKAGTLPSDNPEDYEMEEPTGVWGKISAFASKHSKGLKRTGAAIGIAAVLLGLVKLKGCSDNMDPNQLEESPRPSHSETVTSPAPTESSNVGDFIVSPSPEVSKEPEFLDVSPAPTTSVEPVQSSEPVHTHSFLDLSGTKYRANNDGTHTIESTYKCECGETEVRTAKANCEYVKYSSDGEYEYYECKHCGHKIKKAHNFATLLNTSYKANEDGTHTIEHVYGCGCGEKTTRTEKVACEYVKYGADEEYEYYECKHCGHRIQKAHNFATLKGVTYTTNNNGTHTKNSTYECECGKDVVISEMGNCVYKIYKHDSQKEYLECGDCHYKTTRNHDMKSTTLSNGDTRYTCTHDGCDYSYTVEYEPPYNPPYNPPVTPPGNGDDDDDITIGVEDDLNDQNNQSQTPPTGGDDDDITIDVDDLLGNAEARADKDAMRNTFAYGLGGYGFDDNGLGNDRGFTRSRRL